MDVLIRREAPSDWARVETVVRHAFGRPEEAQLVARLRTFDGVLSLVAIAEATVVGHVMFSPVTAGGVHASPAAYGLAPVAVAGDWQGRGVGSRLIDAGLQELRQARVGVIVVLGHPSYYPRFGFVAATPLGLRCKWGGEGGAFQVLELVPGAAATYRGMVEYLPAFNESAW